MSGRFHRCVGARALHLSTAALMTVALGGLPLGTPSCASPASAQRSPGPAAEAFDDTISDFWREVHTPGARRASTLLRHGLRQLSQALRSEDSIRREQALAGAVSRLRRAHERSPRDLDILYFYAFASSQRQLAQHGPEGAPLVQAAIDLYEQLRTLDAEYEAESVAFELGLLYTRQRAYERAIDEYQAGILRAFDPRSTVSAHANMAEVIMLSGDAERALRHYEHAAVVARQYDGDAASLALALWGSAVAADRLGEGRSAVERAARALQASGGEMTILRTNGVFFEPENELHWYEGLGALALAEAEPESAPRLGHLQRAQRSFQRYLDEVETPAAWDRVARERVEQLAEAIASLQARVDRESTRASGPRRGGSPRPRP